MSMEQPRVKAAPRAQPRYFHQRKGPRSQTSIWSFPCDVHIDAKITHHSTVPEESLCGFLMLTLSLLRQEDKDLTSSQQCPHDLVRCSGWAWQSPSLLFHGYRWAWCRHFSLWADSKKPASSKNAPWSVPDKDVTRLNEMDCRESSALCILTIHCFQTQIQCKKHCKWWMFPHCSFCVSVHKQWLHINSLNLIINEEKDLCHTAFKHTDPYTLPDAGTHTCLDLMACTTWFIVE